MLSTQALLYAVGLGAGAIPVAAAVNWVLKDGLGQLGGVLYAALLGQRFDADPKRHRFFSGVALQAATAVELMTPLLPGYFLLLASVANIGKNVAWLAASATRAQLHQALALQENLGDVTAKSGSQTTVAALLGTGVGVVVSSMLDGTASAAALAYLPFAAGSLYALHRSNYTVAVRTLNVQRAELVLDAFWQHVVSAARERSLAHYVQQAHRHHNDLLAAAVAADPSPLWVPTPDAVKAREHVLRRYRPPYAVAIVVGPPLTTAVAAAHVEAAVTASTFAQVRLDKVYWVMKRTGHAR